MSNTRLKTLIGKRGGQFRHGTFIDCYNQQLFQDFAPTITTRIDHCNHYYVSIFMESDMTRTKLNRYVWYCYRKYEKRVGTDKAREEVSRIFDITVMEKERIKDCACDLNTISDSAGQKISEILIKWGIYKDWMRVMLYEYIDAPHSKQDISDSFPTSLLSERLYVN